MARIHEPVPKKNRTAAREERDTNIRHNNKDEVKKLKKEEPDGKDETGEHVCNSVVLVCNQNAYEQIDEYAEEMGTTVYEVDIPASLLSPGLSANVLDEVDSEKEIRELSDEIMYITDDASADIPENDKTLETNLLVSIISLVKYGVTTVLPRKLGSVYDTLLSNSKRTLSKILKRFEQEIVRNQNGSHDKHAWCLKDIVLYLRADDISREKAHINLLLRLRPLQNMRVREALCYVSKKPSIDREAVRRQRGVTVAVVTDERNDNAMFVSRLLAFLLRRDMRPEICIT